MDETIKPASRGAGGNGSSYRVSRLEADVQELKAGVGGVARELTALRLSLAEAYVPRREVEAQHAGQGKRMDRLEATLSRATWLLLGTLLTAFVSLARTLYP